MAREGEKHIWREGETGIYGGERVRGIYGARDIHGVCARIGCAGKGSNSYTFSVCKLESNLHHPTEVKRKRKK